MTGGSQMPFVKLQNGERLDAVSEESLPEILDKLHPQYNARATFHLSDDEWVSVDRCVSIGFKVSFKNPGSPVIAYYPFLMSIEEVRGIVSSFLRGDQSWKETVPWKRYHPILGYIIGVVVIVIMIQLFVSLVIDLFGWWKYFSKGN